MIEESVFQLLKIDLEEICVLGVIWELRLIAVGGEQARLRPIFS